MNRKALFVLAVLNVIFAGNISDATDLILNNASVQVYFSPDGGCTAAIVNAIDKARTVILVRPILSLRHLSPKPCFTLTNGGFRLRRF